MWIAVSIVVALILAAVVWIGVIASEDRPTAIAPPTLTTPDPKSRPSTSSLPSTSTTRDPSSVTTSRPSTTGGSNTTAPATTSPTAPPSRELAEELEVLERATERVRELKFKWDLNIAIVDQDELARRVTKANERDLDKNEIASEGRRYVVLGAIPESLGNRFFDYLNELFGEQVAGFYDPLTKELVVSAPGGKLDPVSRVTTVHEMVHALTDQHFGFGPKTDELDKAAKDDELLGLISIIEGDATLAMTLFALSDPKSAAGLFGGGDLPASPIFDSSPRYIRDALLFPYEDGLTFVRETYEVGEWAAVDNLYRSPPVSTEQILHPEKYRAKEGPVAVDLPGIDLGAGWSKTAASTLGEATLRQLFRDAMGDDDAAKGAQGWGGDRFVQYENGSETVLTLRVVSDNDAAAGEFEKAAGRWLDRWRKTVDGGTVKYGRSGKVHTFVLSTDPGAADAGAKALGI